MMFKYCLVQYFDYMAQKRKKKKWLKCEDCMFKDKCERCQKGAQDGERMR